MTGSEDNPENEFIAIATSKIARDLKWAIDNEINKYSFEMFLDDIRIKVDINRNIVDDQSALEPSGVPYDYGGGRDRKIPRERQSSREERGGRGRRSGG